MDVKELVLQPQSDIDKVRKYLYENDYVITAEKMVCEEEKYYPMMHVQHGHMEELADIEWKYGAFLLKEKNPVLGSFLKKRRDHADWCASEFKAAAQREGERAYFGNRVVACPEPESTEMDENRRGV